MKVSLLLLFVLISNSMQAQTQFIRPLPIGYSHAVVAEGKMMFISGQVSVNAKGEIVGKGDLKAQTTQVFENLKSLLAEAGADFNDVVKLNTYIVNYKESDRMILRDVRKNYLSEKTPPASTLVGVQALYHPDILIEIEAVAVLKK